MAQTKVVHYAKPLVGGKKTAILEFDWSIEETTKRITLGFRPKYISLYSTAKGSTNIPMISIYNQDLGEIIVRQYGPNESVRLDLPTNGVHTILSVDNDGFTLGKHTYSASGGIQHCHVFVIG